MPITTKDDIVNRLDFQLSSIINNELSAPLPDGINSEDLVHCLLHAAATIYCKTTISVLMSHDATIEYVGEIYDGMIEENAVTIRGNHQR